MGLCVCFLAIVLLCGPAWGHEMFHEVLEYMVQDHEAMAICASIPSEGPGLLYAVRRQCGEKQTCKDICTDQKLRKQGPKEVQNLQWACSESLHVYRRQPHLRGEGNFHGLGPAVYRHYSCTIGGCGPNYCCCRAA